MKKIIVCSMLLVIIIGGLTACGKKSPEKMLENAKQLNREEIQNTINENPAKAEKEYKGKIFSSEGTVISIGTRECTISNDINSAAPMEVVLSIANTDDLAELRLGDQVIVVGELNSIAEKKLEEVSIVKKTPMEDNIAYLTKNFIADHMCGEALLKKADTFERVDGAMLNEFFSAGVSRVFSEWYYKAEDGTYSSVATYENKVETRAGGVGQYLEKGKENIIWSVEGDNLYYKTSNEKDDQLMTDSYKFDVYRIKGDGWEDRSLLCVGNNVAFIIR